MGQQQLLLLVLGAIIVGAAILVGINMFGESSFQANKDGVQQDCLMLAGRLQEYWRKPLALGGAGHDFTGVDFLDLGIRSNTAKLGDSDPLADGDVIWTNEHGTFTIGVTSASIVTVTGVTAEMNNLGAVETIIYTINPTSVTAGAWQ